MLLAHFYYCLILASLDKNPRNERGKKEIDKMDAK